MKQPLILVTALCAIGFVLKSVPAAAALEAGVSRVEITDRDAGPVNDPSYVKALVLRSDTSVAVLITVDAVAIGGIGRITDSFLPGIRRQIQAEFGVSPEHVIVNASHCHSLVRTDTEQLTLQAVKQAWTAMVPVKVGVRSGYEYQISENRRLKMKDGRDIDMRRAYSLPVDADVESVGPIDPQIGVLRIDRQDGRPLAVVYNFACHPIMGAPGGANTAGFPGIASKAIENSLGHGAIAFFVQGCAGDINPIRYKQTALPPNGQPLGNQLGLSVVQTWHEIATRENAELVVVNELIHLPRAEDFDIRIQALDEQQRHLLQSLRPTDINFKSFLPLLIQHRLFPKYPSGHIQNYLHDQAAGRNDLEHHDANIRKDLDAYLANIAVMEELTRLNVNRRLLQKNKQLNEAAGNLPIAAEVAGLRVGDFRLVTFPGELTVQIGLRLKKHPANQSCFVAGYTNGYIFYLPTEQQRANSGFAQEDCDCLVAPQWQSLFEAKAREVLEKL